MTPAVATRYGQRLSAYIQVRMFFSIEQRDSMEEEYKIQDVEPIMCARDVIKMLTSNPKPAPALSPVSVYYQLNYPN